MKSGAPHDMRYCLQCEQSFTSGDWRCPACGFAPSRVGAFDSFAPGLASENSDYDPAYFRLLVTLEDAGFWFRARNELILWALNRFFPAAESLMEIGVGTGYVMRALGRAMPNLRLLGSDIHVEGLQFASARLGNRVDLLQMDARHIPFRDEFDVICLFDVIEHIEEDRAVFEEVRRALRPNGGMILTVPQHMSLWGPADVTAYHKRRYGIQELKKKVRAAGFSVLLKTSFISILLPLLYLSRLRSKRSGVYDITKELRLNAAVATCLSQLLALERMLIQGGVRFPVGGSQLLVAVRN
jgi:SAM-dependent methyltransferase